jgi:hypothetical protein
VGFFCFDNIQRPGESISAHGDHGESVVFYVDIARDEGNPPKVEWIGAKHVVITFEDSRHAKGSKPGKKIAAFHGIDIEYRNL